MQTFQYEGFTVAIQNFFHALVRYFSITYAISEKFGEGDRTSIIDKKKFVSFFYFTHFERCCVLSKHNMTETDKIDEQSIRFWAMYIKVLWIYVENEPMGAPPKLVNNFKKLFLKKSSHSYERPNMIFPLITPQLRRILKKWPIELWTRSRPTKNFLNRSSSFKTAWGDRIWSFVRER